MITCIHFGRRHPPGCYDVRVYCDVMVSVLGCASLRMPPQRFYTASRPSRHRSSLILSLYIYLSPYLCYSNELDRGHEPLLKVIRYDIICAGKTQTVLAMLNVFHMVRYNRYYESLARRAQQRLIDIMKGPRRSIGPRTPFAGLQSLSLDDLLSAQSQSFKTNVELLQKPRILVCSPSNAGVDEIIARLMERGLMDGNLKTYRPDMLRIGRSLQIRAAVKDNLALDVKTNEYLMLTPEKLHARIAFLESQIDRVKARLAKASRDVRSASTQGEADPALLFSPGFVTFLVNELESKSNLLLDLERAHALRRYQELKKDGQDRGRGELLAFLRKSFVEQAHIIFSTLSGAALSVLSGVRFHTMVIDEAAQSVELSTLVALMRDVHHCVLVGDPRQLPATVFLNSESTSLYEKSLFERLESAGHPKLALRIQYRMHPMICEFPSSHFYEKSLQNGASVLLPSYSPAYHANPRFRPFLFFDVSGGVREGSYSNARERRCVLEHIRSLLQEFPEISPGDVGIITFYNQQKRLLQQDISEARWLRPSEEQLEEGELPQKKLEVSTADGFQGREKDIIVISCVRSASATGRRGIGFVADIRRMNVALTRARHALWVFGDASLLMASSKSWAALLNHAKAKGSFVSSRELSTSDPSLSARTTRNHQSSQRPPIRPIQSKSSASDRSNVHRSRLPSASAPLRAPLRPHLRPSLHQPPYFRASGATRTQPRPLLREHEQIPLPHERRYRDRRGQGQEPHNRRRGQRRAHAPEPQLDSNHRHGQRPLPGNPARVRQRPGHGPATYRPGGHGRGPQKRWFLR